MPIYEYQCKACTHTLEAIQKMSDAALVDCPECGKSALSKLVSAPSFRLAGGGWYETDFKTGQKKNLAGEKGSSSSADAGASGDSGARSDAGAGKTTSNKPGSSPAA